MCTILLDLITKLKRKFRFFAHLVFTPPKAQYFEQVYLDSVCHAQIGIPTWTSTISMKLKWFHEDTAAEVVVWNALKIFICW